MTSFLVKFAQGMIEKSNKNNGCADVPLDLADDSTLNATVTSAPPPFPCPTHSCSSDDRVAKRLPSKDASLFSLRSLPLCQARVIIGYELAGVEVLKNLTDIKSQNKG